MQSLLVEFQSKLSAADAADEGAKIRFLKEAEAFVIGARIAGVSVTMRNHAICALYFEGPDQGIKALKRVLRKKYGREVLPETT